jgi:hypothetical protein
LYTKCVFCASDLGRNEGIEPFPVGRRLAFDSGKGRLWVVCRACERWNLTPLEERWEAVEECEKAFRDTRLRFSTENIGLARVADGLDLVRIGRPRRPELAGWRYGDQFGRRRRKYLIGAALGVVAGGGVMIGSGFLLGLSGAALPIHIWNLIKRLGIMRQLPVKVVSSTGKTIKLKMTPGAAPRLLPVGTDDWQLEVAHGKGTEIISGSEAVHALNLLLPRINTSGGSTEQVRRAVRELEEVGDSNAYFSQVEHRARKQGMGYMTLLGLPKEIRLALEMAANEETERAAAEGELGLLERAWREAEEVAAIADNLLVSEKVRNALMALKRRG